MSYDEELAARVRKVLAKRTDVVEKKMFGGLCFMVNGAMCCGLTKSDFMVRVGREQYEDALAQPHARAMDFTGRPLAGMVYVAPEGLRSAAALAKWVARGLSFVDAKPSRAPAKQRKRAPKAARSTEEELRIAALVQAFRSKPQLIAVIEAFAHSQVGEGTTFGRHGLMVKEKLFARFTEGALVVKLPEARVAALVAARAGRRCDPERGRLKQWLKITSPKAPCLELALEARDFAGG